MADITVVIDTMTVSVSTNGANNPATGAFGFAYDPSNAFISSPRTQTYK